MMELLFFPYGMVLRHNTPAGTTEKIVDPEDVAKVLAALAQKRAVHSTGLLSENTLYVIEDAVARTIVEYRPPQKTGFWLDGSDEPIRVPLPGLLMIRSIPLGGQADYRIFAVKERPTSDSAQLFVAPLPNVYADGSICWGNVKRLPDSQLDKVSLAQDWQMLLATKFNDHVVGGKSNAYKGDIRKLYMEMERRKAKRYPLGDMLRANRTLDYALKGMAANDRQI